jgi:hypothetical protein
MTTSPAHVLQVLRRDEELADGERVTERELPRAIALSALVLQYPSVVAYADMLDVLRSAGKIAAAMQLEELWHGLQRRLGFELLCGYSVKGLAS